MAALFSEPIFLIEVAIVVFIVILQFRSYFANKKRMDDYMDVFSDSDTWSVERDDIGRVANIEGGSSSTFFHDIKHTINKYISGSSDSIADYQILKEAVDRHCDSIEDQIESQTPVPLYLGLAGTMIGVIMGLMSLIISGAITDLGGVQEEQKTKVLAKDSVTSGIRDFAELQENQAKNENARKDAEFKKATDGIGSLLLGVAIAMVASFVGISLTTAAAWNYKKRKEDAEKRKNDFMSWMQSELLPELPNDISGAMAQLVYDLEEFNKTFEKNTSSLSKTFDNVNEAYRTQADIVKAVQQMDIQSVATANIRVWQQLQNSTERIERFNQYLNEIQGYTTTIQHFNEQFQQEETQLGLLRKIYDFFNQELHEIEQRKKAIDDAVSLVDQNLKRSFTSLEESQVEQIDQFRRQLQEQATSFNNMLDELKESFSSSVRQISQRLETELSQYPEIVSQLKTISQIPAELRTLSASITRAIDKMVSVANHAPIVSAKSWDHPTIPQEPPKISIPKKLKNMILTFLSIITLCAIMSAVFCGIAAFKSPSTPNTPLIEEDVLPVDTIVSNDSLQTANEKPSSIPSEPIILINTENDD